jgi:glucose uptake protein GlcU
MALTPALIITGIAIALLVVYGMDVIVGYGSEGFIPFDHKTRGMGLGLPALILPIIAYFISRKESSKKLGIMIVVAGVLIIIGGVVVIGNADAMEEASGRNILSETMPLIIAGLVQIGLGILKIKKS